jgi:hypothetical protein
LNDLFVAAGSVMINLLHVMRGLDLLDFWRQDCSLDFPLVLFAEPLEIS